MTMVRKLKSVTTQPTMSMSTLSGMCFVAIAAKGAAITPPAATTPEGKTPVPVPVPTLKVEC